MTLTLWFMRLINRLLPRNYAHLHYRSWTMHSDDLLKISSPHPWPMPPPQFAKLSVEWNWVGDDMMLAITKCYRDGSIADILLSEAEAEHLSQRIITRKEN
jgi:hypothetical protein